MSFGEAISSVLGKYADFKGRARRSEYWYWFLAITLVYIPIFVIRLAVPALGAVLLVLFVLAFLIPNLAVAVRRLHDTGRSGWWLLIGLVPIVGGIVLLVFACLDSQPGANSHGPSPKGIHA